MRVCMRVHALSFSLSLSPSVLVCVKRECFAGPSLDTHCYKLSLLLTQTRRESNTSHRWKERGRERAVLHSVGDLSRRTLSRAALEESGERDLPEE